jgi:phosphatidylinositol phospholipase C delta
LNWQVYDRGMQVNEAMFIGSPGWVAKPLHMQNGDSEEARLPGGREKLVGEIVGVSSCKFFSSTIIYLPADPDECPP